MLADFDAIKQQLVNARLADGTPIPVKTLRDLALEANILPSIFDAKTQDMWLGRARRTASEAQRMALIARDERATAAQLGEGCASRLSDRGRWLGYGFDVELAG